MVNLFKKFWKWLNTPSPYDTWSEAFGRLRKEKEQNGKGSEYWRIWYEEVCPAYRKLTESTPVALRHPLTGRVLEDMDKPVSQRKHF